MARTSEEPGVGKPRGILNPRAGEKRFRLSRRSPSADLAIIVEHYWMIQWDLRGQAPYLSETLPHPSVHLVVEEERSGVFGVMRGKFSRVLEDEGRVFGIKFRPGGFHPFLRSPVSGLTDRVVGLRDAFGAEGEAYEEAILALEDEGEMVETVEDFLRERSPERDENVEAVNRIVDRIAADRGITKVVDAANSLHLSKRTLQRLFERYVGVGPKWVIRRYRLHEAADRLAANEPVDLPTMALDLGYFDQAHFIKDFKAIVGTSPAQYATGCDQLP